jgi:hypothetical protein
MKLKIGTRVKYVKKSDNSTDHDSQFKVGFIGTVIDHSESEEVYRTQRIGVYWDEFDSGWAANERLGEGRLPDKLESFVLMSKGVDLSKRKCWFVPISCLEVIDE